MIHRNDYLKKHTEDHITNTSPKREKLLLDT